MAGVRGLGTGCHAFMLRQQMHNRKQIYSQELAIRLPGKRLFGMRGLGAVVGVVVAAFMVGGVLSFLWCGGSSVQVVAVPSSYTFGPHFLHTFAVTPARANIFTKILREAGEGGRSARHGLDFPSGAARLVSKLPQKPGHLALAAHATSDGHWKFVNGSGDVFTAATPEEMSRVVQRLAPEGTSVSQKLSLYLSEESLFERAEFIDKLPKGSSHHLVVGQKSFPLSVVSTAGGVERVAQVRPRVVVPLRARKAFDEAIWQLSRPLRKADIRVLSLRPGARASLPPSPRFNKTTRQAMVDEIDPGSLPQAMSAVSGQTLLVSGEIRGPSLFYVTQSGAKRSLNLGQLREGARNADVNLIILRSSSPQQPGGRNWFWQTVEVDGLKEAINRATFADFLNALGVGEGGHFRVTATAQGRGRVIVEAVGDSQKSLVPYSDMVGDWIGNVVSNVTGNVVTTGVSAYMRDKERQQELDNRIVPGIPSIFQMFYLGSIIIGLFAWSVSREVWGMIWPPEKRAEYRSAFGYHAARVVKTLVFLLVFLPVAGIPMMILTIILQIWTVLGWIWSALMSPLRLWRWLRNSRA